MNDTFIDLIDANNLDYNCSSYRMIIIEMTLLRAPGTFSNEQIFKENWWNYGKKI